MLYGKAYFQGGAIILTLILLLSISASTRSYLSDSSSQSVPNINVLHATAYTLGLDFQFSVSFFNSYLFTEFQNIPSKVGLCFGANVRYNMCLDLK